MDAAIKFPTTPKAIRAARVKLAKRMNVEQAFQAIMTNCIVHIDANTRGVAVGQDAESLHQMRVGVRRLRAALSVVNDILHLPPGLRQDLDWLALALGEARDWDVLAESTLPAVEAGAPDVRGLATLRLAALDKTRSAHAAAAATVASQRYLRFLRALQNWVDQRGWRDALIPGDKMKLKMRVTTFAHAILEQDQQRLLKRGRKLKGASPDARHRLRIVAKKTRYAAEFFGSLYPDKKVRPYIKALASLQDELGHMNDAVVAQRLLKELQEGRDDLSDSVGFARGYLTASLEHGEVRARKCWNVLAPLAPPHGGA